MKLIAPATIEYGDRVALIAPAGAAHKQADIQRSKKFLEELGFEVILGASIKRKERYLAGTDLQRAKDLNNAFKERKIKAVFCLRGGYGSIRILDLLDYENIRKNPKPFIGFSDITALHIAIRKYSGLMTYHGPTINSLSAKKDRQIAQSSKFLFELLTERHKKFELSAKLTVIKGDARGELVGGNLATLVSLVGSKYQPSLKGAVLYLEEIAEAPYKLDRMLTQIEAAGMLDRINGVACGVFKECGKEAEIIKILSERFSKYKIPVLYGLPFGHVALNLTLINGGTASIKDGQLFVYRSHSA